MPDETPLLTLLLSGCDVLAAARRRGSRTARVIQRLDAAVGRRWQARQPCARGPFSRKAR
jgi:hypothetical protein